jgi:glycosyltransferase involved in cell wall biosynthesis
MPIKVHHFLNYARLGGITGTVYDFCTHSKHKHTYVTFNCDPKLKQKFYDAGIEVVEFPCEEIDSVVAYMKDHADIVHAQNSGGPEPGVHIGVESGKPTVETCQSPSLPQGRIHKQVAVVTVSHGILHHWPEELKPHRVIYSCTRQINSKLSKKECKEKFNLDPDKYTVGRIGRLEGIKRPQDYVRAVAYLGKMRPDLQFLLVGDGSDGEGIRNLSSQLMSEHNIGIQMPGFLTGEDKNDAIMAMDVFLYPTTMEGFGVSFAEAMSAGIPIITYSDPVNIDVVGPAGLFVADNEYTNTSRPFATLAKATTDLVENKREYDKLSAYGKKIWKERYTPERMAEQYDELYKELVT